MSAVCTGLLFTACGVTPEEFAPDERLGTHQAAVCTGAQVSSLVLLGYNFYQGTLSSGGTWAVTTPSNAIYLEYYVDGVRVGSEDRPGTSGSWYHSSTGWTCSTQAFEVRAWPLVVDGSGVRSLCTANGPVTMGTSVRDQSCCMPETDAQFCARLGKQCGPVGMGTDNCGNPRSVDSCGNCPSGSQCDWDLNVCVPRPCEPESSCVGRCGCVSDGCGGMVNCGICPTYACPQATPFPCCDGSCSKSRLCPGIACDPWPNTCWPTE
ncbi:hypothetical protein ACN28E_42975 [Archangium lansingense]